MDIKFTFEGDNVVEKAIALKTFIDEENIKGIQSVEVERKPGKEGDQGIGSFLGSIVASLAKSVEAVKSLSELIGRFTELFDGRLIIDAGNGKKLVIPGGKKLTPEQIENIAINFSDHN